MHVAVGLCLLRMAPKKPACPRNYGNESDGGSDVASQYSHDMSDGEAKLSRNSRCVLSVGWCESHSVLFQDRAGRKGGGKGGKHKGRSVKEKAAARAAIPKACTLSPVEVRHYTDGECPIFPGRIRKWGDYKKNGYPRAGVCRICKSTHKLLFGHLTQVELLAEFERDPTARKKFDDGTDMYVAAAKRKAEKMTDDQDVNQDDDDNEEVHKKKKRRRDHIQDTVADEEADDNAPPPETAETVKRVVNGVKRRGQYVLRRVWDLDNPGKVPNPKDLRPRPSRADPKVILEYVKVYRDVDEERLDFSEAENDEVAHHTSIDNGRLIISEDQVANAASAAARTLLNQGDRTSMSSRDVAVYTGVGGSGNRSESGLRTPVAASPNGSGPALSPFVLHQQTMSKSATTTAMLRTTARRSQGR